MPLKTVPVGPYSEVHYGSDVAGVIFSGKYLLVQVACDIDAKGLVHGLAVVFPDASAFRYLDEMDLARYWTSDGFVLGFHVLEVSAGGWSDEEDQMQGFTTSRREWIVVTGNGCISVFAHDEPQVHAVTWQCDEDQV